MFAERLRARLAMQERESVERRERARTRGVVRRLDFQDEEQDQNQDRGENHVDNVANQMAEEAKSKWNFDFVNEKPLPGVWEWEKVEPAGRIKNNNENREVIRREINRED